MSKETIISDIIVFRSRKFRVKVFSMCLLLLIYNGEILNNGTDTVRAVEVSAIFYNDSGIVGYESDRTDPTTIDSAERAVFVLPIIDEVILSDAENYEFTIKWQDEYSRDYFVRLTGGDIPDDSDSGGDDCYCSK